VNAKPKVLALDAQVGTKPRQCQESCRTDAGTQQDRDGKHNECEGKEVASLCCQIVVLVEVWRKKEPAVLQNTLISRKHTKITLMLHFQVWFLGK
jgi:hypothetical protein